MVSLWGQNRTAEIDSLNTLACVVTSCLLIDMGYKAGRGRALISIAAGLAFGAAMLLKGPVGLTGIGSALIGPAIFNRTGKAVKQPWPWIALGIGGCLFGVYACVAIREFRALGLPLETSGVNEIWINLWNSDRIKYLVPTIFLPVILAVYAVPVSFFLPMAFYGRVWNSEDVERRELVRAIVGTLATACIVTMLCGFSFPRYSYSWLPLMCLAAGAVVEAWIGGVYPRKLTDWLHVSLAAVGIAFVVSIIVLVALCWKARVGNEAVLICAAAIGVVLCALIIQWIVRDHQPWAIGALVVMLFITAPLYGMREAADREHRSAASFAAVVRSKVPVGQTVTTGHILLDQPEIFYYSGVNVESHPLSMFIPREYPTSRWMILDAVEYDAWRQKMPGRLTDVQVMQNQTFSGVLAWYEAKGTPVSESGE
jgi:4-amino-4-deoxy-L-arabinose transferase-like glycosyltransferase